MEQRGRQQLLNLPSSVLVSEANRHVLVETGAVSVFIKLLESTDEDVQFYSAAALSNLAVHGERW